MPLTGASDHLVSEAIYLDDPEGNGIEVYSDRPPDRWGWDNGRLVMATDPLDLQDLLKAADAPTEYRQAPPGLRIGHVHLRVGDAAEAENFYSQTVGLDLTTRYPGASFLSSGGYHHHLAANQWQSRGAGRRDPDRAGLSHVTFEASDAATLDALKERLRARGTLSIADGLRPKTRGARACDSGPLDHGGDAAAMPLLSRLFRRFMPCMIPAWLRRRR